MRFGFISAGLGIFSGIVGIFCTICLVICFVALFALLPLVMIPALLICAVMALKTNKQNAKNRAELDSTIEEGRAHRAMRAELRAAHAQKATELPDSLA